MGDGDGDGDGDGGGDGDGLIVNVNAYSTGGEYITLFRYGQTFRNHMLRDGNRPATPSCT